MKTASQILLLTLALTAPGPLWAHHADALLGGALGGALGAVIGSELGGRDGAIWGGAIGGALGAAITLEPRYHRHYRYHRPYVIERRFIGIDDGYYLRHYYRPYRYYGGPPPWAPAYGYRYKYRY